MLNKLKELSEAARLRASVWMRERKERAEEKKATAAAMANEHGHGRFFLLHVPAMATICAAVVEWYWAILFCIESTGFIDWNYQTTTGSNIVSASTWNFTFETHWPIFLGLVCATIPIVMLSMVWLPVQFAMRGSGMWRRGTVIAVGVLANILVIVSGTVVMNGNRQEQVREAVVVEQTAQQGRAAIDARLAFEQEQLRLALTNENAYLNQAASVGASEWERSYVAQARATNDPRLPQLERALGAARAADERRANIERLTIERATAAPEAASAANVEDTVGAELNTFAQIVEVWRPPFVAVICCLIGIFGAWWVLALMQGLNPRDVLRSGWADEGHRIEDMRSQPSVVPEPMQAPREAIYDAETGEELTHVRSTWRKKPKRKGKPERVETAPEIPPDETGVTIDGGNRIAVGADGLGGVMESEAPVENIPNAGEQVPSQDGDGEGQDNQEDQVAAEAHPEPSIEMSEEDLAVLYELAAAENELSQDKPLDGVSSDDAADDQTDNESYDHNQPRETNPARLLAAE